MVAPVRVQVPSTLTGRNDVEDTRIGLTPHHVLRGAEEGAVLMIRGWGEDDYAAPSQTHREPLLRHLQALERVVKIPVEARYLNQQNKQKIKI